MKLMDRILCPYCGTENRVFSEKQLEEQVVVCDIDVGGCDKMFAVRTRAKLETEVYEMKKIEDN